MDILGGGLNKVFIWFELAPQETLTVSWDNGAVCTWLNVFQTTAQNNYTNLQLHSNLVADGAIVSKFPTTASTNNTWTTTYNGANRTIIHKNIRTDSHKLWIGYLPMIGAEFMHFSK